MVSHFISFFFFFKQKTAYEMRISDWSSDVCSSDLNPFVRHRAAGRPDEAGNGVEGGGLARAVGPHHGEYLARPDLERQVADRAQAGEQIGRASCRERVCQYV